MVPSVSLWLQCTVKGRTSHGKLLASQKIPEAVLRTCPGYKTRKLHGP
ncbi:MAG: hypothetical protein E7F36_14340 [Klebsiella oxytoca]|nr:hypothetical protein [Klebsiella oxytoca]